MAWNNTVDERYGGGYLSLSSDSYDASNLLNSTYTLAAGQTGYGNLTDWYSSADIDTYSLGILGVGSYVLDVDDYTWDFASFDYGSVSRFELLNASGTVVATRYGTFSNIDFTVSSADTYYVRIHGPSFGEAQYSVTYLSSNTPAVFGEATYVGDLQPGSVLSGSVAYVDANGNSDNIVLTQWSVGGADSGFAETYTVTAEDVGESIQFRFWFTDDLGNIEYSGWYSLGTVEPAPQSNSEPTGSVVISGTPEEGQTLTVSNDLSDADGIGTISYQWNRNGEAIEGATGDSYTLAAEDVGTEITVTASYTDGGSTDESVASQGTDAVAARGEERADFTKSLLIVIDDFSERVFDYSNVTLFDYGTYQNITYIDNAFSPVTREYTGYDFTYDDLIVNEADTGGFHMVTHDEDTSYAVDYDFVGRTEAVGWDGETAYLDTFWQFDRLDQSTEELPNHGDWVIESIVQTLDDPSSTSILAIDVDTLNGVGSHFDSLFRQSAYTHSTLGDLTLTGLERVLLDYLDLYDTNFNDEATESFFPSGVSVSIAGAPATVREAAVFTFLEELFIPIFQAAPNVNQGHYDWGSNYVDVINVGAWNTDSSGDLLLSSINTVETLDLVADGHIQKEGWGDNFGTSFATPKVAAEWTNLINFYIASLQDESSSSSGGDNDSDEGVVDIDYTEYVSFIVDFVSTPVEVRFNNPALDLLWNDTYDYVRVLNDTVEANGYEPLELGYVDLGIDGTSLASATLFDAESSIETNNSPTGTVSIAGTATQGETLTASNDLSDVDGLGSISYQWNRDDVAITGATNSTYTLTQDDVGTEITVTASYTDGFGTEESVTSVEASVVANVNDAPAGSVSITGTATQGETLTASNDLADVDGLGSISYQWNRDDVAITGATNSTYTLTQDDVGTEITVTASYTDGFGTEESVTSVEASVVANVNDAPAGSVSITGTATQGETLTASNDLADVDGLGSISYQWNRDDVAITGATNSTYTLTQDDVGTEITVTASYTDGFGTEESVTSVEASVVANVNDAPAGSVSITGTATQGETLTASNDLADVDGLGSISYQWNRDDVAITGATNSTYTLTQDDVGTEITVTASYTDGFGTEESVTSVEASVVANVNDAPAGSVSITGTATQGETLTASNDLADVDGLGSISYQWNRDDVAITGATNSTYTLTQDDVGTEITVTASYTDDQDTDEAVTSSATSAVANVNDAPTGSVTISGTATQGQTLTASNDLADIDGLGTIAYQWNRDDVAITGATTSTYTLTQDDVGAEITVTASYTDDQDTDEAVTSSATSAVASSVLKTVEGHIYHWSSHKLMSDVTVEMMSDLHMTGDSPFLLQNLRAGDEGETLFDVVFDAGTDLIETLDLTINLQDGATGSFAWSDSLSSNNWQTQVNATETAILISGFQASGTSSGILAVGTLTLSGLDLNSLSIDLVNGGTSLNSIDTIYADTSATIEHSSFTTDAEGAFTVQVNSELNYHLTGTRELTDTETGRVVSAADALAALKLAVGNNPSGFDEISPYQLLAADVNQDGRVSAADALAILKMAVGLEGAPEREWIFVNETADFENADGLRFNRARIDWDQLDEPLGSGELNLVGLLKGDVNGSWPGPQADGFSQLPDSYFNDLETSGIGPAEQWWVV